MIIPVRWKNVQTGERVIDPAGQIFHVLPRMVAFLAQLRDRRGTYTLPVNPQANVPVIFDEQSIAVANLRAVFPSLEMIKESQ